MKINVKISIHKKLSQLKKLINWLYEQYKVRSENKVFFNILGHIALLEEKTAL